MTKRRTDARTVVMRRSGVLLREMSAINHAIILTTNGCCKYHNIN
jgi:hypothetical protein